MLAHRIIPTVLNKHGTLVKGEQFRADRVIGDSFQASRIFGMRGVDELIICDVTATDDRRDPDYEKIKKLSDRFFTPLTVGGGIRDEIQVRQLLRSGADKVCINTAALENPNIISHLSNKFGSQCITVSIDVKNGYVYSRSGKVGHMIKALDWAVQVASLGAGEILLQSIDRDGTMKGYDLDMIKVIARNVSCPVIASGGCSGYEDAYYAIMCGASAVAAGALWAFTDCTPKGMAEYLNGRNVEVRL